MKWRKLGKIFDPAEHALPLGCVEWAQAPQALVCGDFIRIYFSTRQKDANGKFLSHIAFVDMSKDLGRVLSVSKRPVVKLGGLGTFDEHGIFPLNVVRDGDRILGYIGGWSRRIAVPVDGSIGFATSRDGGETFQKAGPGPILTASLHEPFMVGDPFVAWFEGVYHMWYIFGTRWIRNASDETWERVYKVAHATSPDGLSWTKEDGSQIVADKLGADECQALPTVARIDGRYHMYFCYREAIGFRTDRNRTYRIGQVQSDDLKTWSRDDASVGIDVSAAGWDSDMLCYPHLFSCDSKTYLLYNGNEFGRRGFGAAVAVDWHTGGDQ